MNKQFKLDAKLGISIPVLDRLWEEYSAEEQEFILAEWEKHRADIPGRIKELESIIEDKQEALGQEEDFTLSVQLNHEISELASSINDLNIWYRIQQDTETKAHR